MQEILTIAEIEKRYDGEWVLIENPEVDVNLDIVRGRVVYHNVDRDEFDRKSLNSSGTSFAVRFIGQSVPEMEFVL